MADLQSKYPASPHSTVALTLALSLLSPSTTLLVGRASTAVDNTTNLDLDHLVSGAITTGGSPTGGGIEVWVYAARSIASGTPAYPDTITGTDVTVALTSANVKAAALVPVTTIPVDTTGNRTYSIAPFSIAALFGGSMPPFWGLFIVHNTGTSLNATGVNHSFNYERVQGLGVASAPAGPPNITVSRTDLSTTQTVGVTAPPGAASVNASHTDLSTTQVVGVTAPGDTYFPFTGDVARYFPAAATLVTYANRATLQSVLNSAKIVRLEAADYSSQTITMTTDMQLYGVPNRKTTAPTISVAAGSHDVVIKGLEGNGYDARITFPSSSTLTYNVCVGMVNTLSVYGVGATIERLTVVGSEISYVHFDNTSGGYLRNSRFIRHATTQGGHTGAGVFAGKPIFNLVGNSSMSSYGNTVMAAAHLGAYTGQIYVENHANFGLMNIEVESYSDNVDGKAVLNFINCGSVRVSVGDGLVRAGQRVLDNGATNLVMTDYEQDYSGVTPYYHRSNALRSFMFNCPNPTSVSDAASTKARFTSSGGTDPIRYNGSTTMDSTAVTEATTLLKTSGASTRTYGLPTLRTVPDPAPSNWKTARASATDNRAALQALLDANTSVCFIPSGIYYVATALRYYKDQVIVGAGSDVCAIIAKTDSINVFESGWGNTTTNQYGSNSLVDIAIYGGKDGWAQNTTGSQLALFSFSHIVFRDCTGGGFHLDHTACWDNGFLENIDFVNCGSGMKQTGYIPPDIVGDLPELCYMDKTVFHRCQWIDCDVAFDNNAAHVSGAQQFNECYFKDNGKLFQIQKYTTKWCLSNCVLDGNVDNDTWDQRFVYEGCAFIGKSGDGALHGREATFASCTFTTTSGSQTVFGESGNYLAIDCDFGTMPLGTPAPIPSGSYSFVAVNSKFAAANAVYEKVISTNNQQSLINVAVAVKTKLFREGNGV